MTTAGMPLADLQRRLWRLIAAPEGVRRSLADAGDPEGRTLAEIVRGDAILGAVERLEVYANAYFYRIEGRLEEDYRALAASLGDEWFHDLVTAYLEAHPPRHSSLRFAGDRLAGFLRDHGAGAPFRARFPWAADLARFEWALVDAFDAPDSPVLPREALAAVPPEAWGGLRFGFQSALATVDLAWPVRALRRALDRGEPVTAPAAPAAARACVWRHDERVFHRILDGDEAEGLGMLRRGATFGELCERLAAAHDERGAPARAASLLARWQRDGWLAHLEGAA